MEGGGQGVVVEGLDDFDDGGDTGRGLGVTDVGLDGAQPDRLVR